MNPSPLFPAFPSQFRLFLRLWRSLLFGNWLVLFIVVNALGTTIIAYIQSNGGRSAIGYYLPLIFGGILFQRERDSELVRTRLVLPISRGTLCTYWWSILNLFIPALAAVAVGALHLIELAARGRASIAPGAELRIIGIMLALAAISTLGFELYWLLETAARRIDSLAVHWAAVALTFLVYLGLFRFGARPDLIPLSGGQSLVAGAVLSSVAWLLSPILHPTASFLRSSEFAAHRKRSVAPPLPRGRSFGRLKPLGDLYLGVCMFTGVMLGISALVTPALGMGPAGGSGPWMSTQMSMGMTVVMVPMFAYGMLIAMRPLRSLPLSKGQLTACSGAVALTITFGLGTSVAASALLTGTPLNAGTLAMLGLVAAVLWLVAGLMSMMGYYGGMFCSTLLFMGPLIALGAYRDAPWLPAGAAIACAGLGLAAAKLMSRELDGQRIYRMKPIGNAKL